MHRDACAPQRTALRRTATHRWARLALVWVVGIGARGSLIQMRPKYRPAKLPTGLSTFPIRFTACRFTACWCSSVLFYFDRSSDELLTAGCLVIESHTGEKMHTAPTSPPSTSLVWAITRQHVECILFQAAGSQNLFSA